MGRKLEAIIIRSRLTLLLGTILVALSAAAPAQSPATPYDLELAGLQARYARTLDPAARGAIVERAWRLRDYVNDAAALEGWLGMVAAGDRSPLVRTDARLVLAEAQLRRGNLAAAGTAYAQLGFVRSWRVAGPSIAGAATAVSPGATPGIDLADLSMQSGAFTAATSLDVPKPGEFVLTLTTTVPARLLVNGALAIADCAGECSVGVRLEAGRAPVIVELRRSADAPARMTLRLSASDGDPVALAAQPGDPKLPAAPPVAARSAATTLLTLAQAAVAADPNDAARREVLADLERPSNPGAALADAEAAARRQPTAARWIATAELAPEPGMIFQALQQALRLEPDNPRALDLLARYYAARDQREKARDLWRRALDLSPSDFVVRKRLDDLYAAAGLDSIAAADYDRLERECPGPIWLRRELAPRYEGYGWMARARALAESAARDDAPTVRELLQRIATEQRDSAALQRWHSGAAEQRGGPEVSLRQAAATDAPAAIAAEAAPYLADASRLAAEARRSAPAPDADEVVLARVRVERVFQNGLSAVRQQEIVYLASDAAARDAASRSVQYAPQSEQLRVVHARIFKPDGRVLEAQDEGDTPVADASIAMYYDVRARTLRFPDLEKGDVVELDYCTTPVTAANPYGDYFGELTMFRGRRPSRLQRWVLITPAARAFAIHEEHMAPARVALKGGDRVYQWELRDTAALPDEPRGPAPTAFAPYVHVSTFASWSALGRWYAGLIRPQFALDAGLRQALGRVLAGKHGDLEKIQAIDEFVLRSTHYVAFEFGVYSYKPYPVAQVYARRFGDCKDKASLAIALLRAAGIDADLALVRTRPLGPVAGQTASISVFNHAVAYLPKYDLWLDGTAEYSGLHELPLDDQGAMALTVTLDGRAQLHRIPVSGPDDNFTRRTLRARLARDGSIAFTGTSYTRGEDAPGLRREYQSPDSQREAVRARLSEVFANVHIDDVNADTALQRDVNVNFRGRLGTYTGRRLVSVAASWTPPSFVQRLAPLTQRETDLILPAAWSRQEHLRFEVPRGAEVAALPPDANLHSAFGTAHVTFRQHGREIAVDTFVELTRTTVAPAEYAAFRDFCRRLERAFQQQVTVALPPGEDHQ